MNSDKRLGTRSLTQAHRTLCKKMGMQPLRDLPLIGAQLVSTKGSKLELNSFLQLSGDGVIASIEPNYRRRTRVIPNDAFFGDQINLHNDGTFFGTFEADIDAPEAWDIRSESPNTVVAIIDTGIYYDHLDLIGNIWVNAAEIPGNGVDDDANGFVDDVHGYDFRNKDGDPLDDEGHGTHVAGIVGARGNDLRGVSGVSWKVQLMALKFLGSDGSGSVADSISAIEYAIDMGAHVINASYGGGSFSSAEEAAIAAARDAGVIFVAAAGNNQSDNDTFRSYPDGYDLDNIVSVAASDIDDRLAFFSNFGSTSVDLAAPGELVLSTIPGSGARYMELDGTSMAAPHVSGAIALVREQFPTMTYAQVIERILTTTDGLESFAGKVRSNGRLNLARALGVSSDRPFKVLRANPEGKTKQNFSSIELNFSDPVDLGTLDISLLGPDGEIEIGDILPVENTFDRRIKISFEEQGTVGEYTLRINESLKNRSGEALDQDGDGTAGESSEDVFTHMITLEKPLRFSFPCGGGPLVFDFGEPAVRTIDVDRELIIEDIDVRVDLSVQDLFDSSSPWQIQLISPKGGMRSLHFEVFRDAEFRETIFDSEADTSSGEGRPPYTGRFRPSTDLSSLNGSNAGGRWSIYLKTFNPLAGVFESCSLDILATLSDSDGEGDSDGDGVPNAEDECDSDPEKSAPGFCGCGAADIDTDLDGTPNCIDFCPTDANKLFSGSCGCGVSDADSDGDGIPDCRDGCPNDPEKLFQGACGCGVSDIDTDFDFTADCNDSCPNDANKVEPGICGCGVADIDSDGDGVVDCIDSCPMDREKVKVGQCGCGVVDTDSDADGVADCVERCPLDPDKLEPGVCGCGVSDTDSDGDGISDCRDSCPSDPAKLQAGICGCGVADTDSDGDGTVDCVDSCPNDASKLSAGVCGCGTSDIDSDGDGTADCKDSCAGDADKTEPGNCGCGEEEIGDLNQNGILECSGEMGTVDIEGSCVPGAGDCIHEQLDSRACVGANGFLGQINIATVINKLAVPLEFLIEYVDAAGIVQDSLLATLEPTRKRDFLVNEMGLQPDTFGNVCVTAFVDSATARSESLRGAWEGGMAIYKPDFREGVPNFGERFDYSLWQPFKNPSRWRGVFPINTSHLGTDPSSTVANWISLSDPQRDDKPLTGTLIFEDRDGIEVARVDVNIADGGRADFSGHQAIGGLENRDAVGTGFFIPDMDSDGRPLPYLSTLTRYFYDCLGASCNNFLTAFNVPERPATSETVYGRVSTLNGEIAVIELNNAESNAVRTEVSIQGGTSGSDRGGMDSVVSGTEHIIVNRVGESGFLSDEAGFASVTAKNGNISALSFFYKLDENGRLSYAYVAPFTGSPGEVQVSQFNSFIGHQNISVFHNPNDEQIKLQVDSIDFKGENVFSKAIEVAPGGTERLDMSDIPGDLFGTVVAQSEGKKFIFGNYISRPEYTQVFLGQ